ncbi:Proteasome inhibitor PI31 subunit [Fasciola gigantica]|uniref:Proteasome inhibitor PI31 subunit n=1 Tax=Fasciola gigantica TaxID=46835 RepID=A0A504YBE8_FASGI|nr:Proteasome inhibitor PI31 subunit [Fasciola gigantica]
MSEQPGASQAAPSETGQRSVTKLSPFETSFLEYVLAVHGKACSRRACLIALLVHAQLLSRGARLSSSSRGSSSLILASALDSDPIRLSYTLVPRPQSETLASAASQLQLSVTETDAHLFISLTDTVTDKFGHLEISGMEHVSLDDCPAQCSMGDLLHVFPHLDELLLLLDASVWKPVLPSPPRPRVSEHSRFKDTKSPGPDDYIQLPIIRVREIVEWILVHLEKAAFRGQSPARIHV